MSVCVYVSVHACVGSIMYSSVCIMCFSSSTCMHIYICASLKVPCMRYEDRYVYTQLALGFSEGISSTCMQASTHTTGPYKTTSGGCPLASLG